MTASLSKYDVAVVGLGAVGSATLYQLSKSGCRVLGIDRFSPPHSLGSSHGESRITRLAVGEGEDYIALAKRSHELWREIESETGMKLMTITSGILMDSGVNAWGKHGSMAFWDQTLAFAKRHQISHQVFGSDFLRKIFPAFQLESSGKVYLEEQAGFLRPELCIQAQLELARKNGAEIVANSQVEELRQKGDAILIRTSIGEVMAEKVLLSAGGWIKDFLPEAEQSEFKICRQVLHWLEIDPDYTDWERYPVWMWGFGARAEDFIYGFPSLDGKTVKMATESFVDAKHPDFLDRLVTEEEQARFWKEKVSGRILGVRPRFAKSEVCFYTVTQDARFVVKPLPAMPRALMVSACSGHGFKHSAALGEMLAKTLSVQG
jgi:sarcosine oxidase